MSRSLFASDAGGTMTDVIIVDAQGRFVIGKGPTTAHDEGIGYTESLAEAFTDLGKTLEKDGREVRTNCATEALYRDWLGRPLADEQEFVDRTLDVAAAGPSELGAQ